MSADRDALLELVRPDRDCNLGAAARRLGLSEEEVRALAEELVDTGHCEWVNERKRRIRKTVSTDQQPNGATAQGSSGSADNSEASVEPPSEPAELTQVSQLARDLWAALPTDGAQITNVEIRSREDFAEVDGRDLQEARRELKRAGLVELRAGRDGGGLRRVDVAAEEDDEEQHEVSVEPPRTDGAVPERLEHELYEPFRDWLVQELDEDSFVFAEAVVTARARRQGKWTQPDVCQLTVTNFENLPTATVELSTYELKRRADAGKLEAVYEAAAHGRWAHRTNLVLEVENRDSKIAPEILKDAERFGLGVYKLWLGEAGRASVQQLLTSRVQAPEDADLDDMIGVVLDQIHVRHKRRYRQAVK